MIRSFSLTRLPSIPRCKPTTLSPTIHRRLFSQITTHHASKPRLRTKRPAITPTTTPAASRTVEPSLRSPTSTLLYPDSLLIYHRSNLRTATQMVTVVLPYWALFMWGAFIYFDSPLELSELSLMDFSQILKSLAGVLPIFLLVPVTRGFVTKIHLHLPLEARGSFEALRKWAERMPRDALVEVQTVGAWGMNKPVWNLRIAELRARKHTILAPQNFDRVLVRQGTVRRREGFISRWRDASRGFIISNEKGTQSKQLKEPWLWAQVVKRIEEIQKTQSVGMKS